MFYQRSERNEFWWSWTWNPMLQYLRNFFVLLFSCFVLFISIPYIQMHIYAWFMTRFQVSSLQNITRLTLGRRKTNKLRLPDTFDRWRILFKLWFLSHSKGLRVIFSVIFKRKKEKMEKSKCWRRNDGYETLVTPKEKWSTRICFTIIVLKSSKIGATQPLNL